jgi:hypothetical protein
VAGVSDVPSVSCAAVGHAVAGFITAIFSPMGSLPAGVSAVSAVPTAAGWKWFLRFPMSLLLMLLASLLLLAPCHAVGVPGVDGTSDVANIAAVATSSLLLPLLIY